jgi:transposase
LWALDEVHFQQHGSRCRMWVPPENRDPICLHHPTRKSISYFGAVRLRDGRLATSSPSGRFDGQSFWDFLRRLHRTSRVAGRRVVVISDNARYHHALLHAAWRQQRRKTFALEFLPPYSPQLNPIERVWKLLRRRCLHNQYFACLSLLTKTVDQQFAAWAKPNQVLRKLCVFS